MSRTPDHKPYPDVATQGGFAEIEERILAFWKAENIFQESVDSRATGDDGANEFVFYDGPPFANGLPHYGHLLTGFVKDVVPRYQTMRGRRVERRFGWDCHGLPAEMEAERELKVSGRSAIQEYGIDKFNQYCQKSVLRFTGEWESYVTRQARWVDFEHDYKTMDLSYMESVMWAFKQLWDKGLVYESYRVMPYSWACETPLSNFETRIDNSFRPRQDPAITVAFTLHPRDGDPGPLKVLVWTTTPWTLPSNLALALGPDIDYAVVEKDGVFYVLGAATISKYDKELAGARPVGIRKGREFTDRTYDPLFPYFKDHPGAFRVLAADFVDTEEGTGVVHMAPGFGEEDQRSCEAHGIAVVCPVDEKGRFTKEVPDYEGQMVLEANKPIIRHLKQQGVLVKHVVYEHNYPHCWRTDTPLIYRAVNSWNVAVTRIKDRMLELNQQINWIPEHIRDGQFGNWLLNARDWSISRNRFWGSPIPVWRSDNPEHPRVDVYGSLDEIERDFGVRPNNLHRPWVDQLTRPNPDDPKGSTMRRVPEVLDCWFESGSMPFAQIHYPFANKEWFENHFPADFIVEYVAQTRGWFYTMMVLATALFDRPPFRNCICHGVVTDEDGKKLSKRLRNYPDPERIFASHGADALRWFMISSPILRGKDLQIDKQGRAIGDVVRRVLNPIWSTYHFFTLYANIDGITANFRTDSEGRLDRYILAKTREQVQGVQEALDAYDLAGACQVVITFLDALNNWYIRRSRDRFWKSEQDQDKRDAYDTLYTVLHVTCRVAAPLLPLLTEEIYRGLTGERSVHLTDWPDAGSLPDDPDLVRDMDRVRDACSQGLSLREAHRLRIRLPLRRLTIAGRDARQLQPYEDLLRDELNVKEVCYSDDIEQFGAFHLQVNAALVGPRLGPAMKEVMAAVRKGDWQLSSDGAEVGGHRLGPDEFTMLLKAAEGVASQALSANDALVALDVEVTPELEEEGLARDLVRLVQQARKEAGLHVSDRIRLMVSIPDELTPAITRHRTYIGEQTLGRTLEFGDPEPGFHRREATLGGHSVVIGLMRLE